MLWWHPSYHLKSKLSLDIQVTTWHPNLPLDIHATTWHPSYHMTSKLPFDIQATTWRYLTYRNVFSWGKKYGLSKTFYMYTLREKEKILQYFRYKSIHWLWFECFTSIRALKNVFLVRCDPLSNWVHMSSPDQFSSQLPWPVSNRVYISRRNKFSSQLPWPVSN